jgi:broad specificity phosphatase PhoE
VTIFFQSFVHYFNYIPIKVGLAEWITRTLLDVLGLILGLTYTHFIHMERRAVMTKIILTRHGHVDWIAPERYRGRAELTLSELGQQQIKANAHRIASTWQPAAIYTSPMGRCIETGRAIAEALQSKIVPSTLDGLNDIDYGLWQGLTKIEVQEKWPRESKAWHTTPHLTEIPHGETLAAVLARLTHGLYGILHQHVDETIVLVGHDSVNRVLLMHAMGLPLSCYWHFKQDPCSITEIDFKDDIFYINSLNETFHLS